MRDDAKVICAINDMRRAELGAVIFGVGYTLPADKSIESLRAFVLRLYRRGAADSVDILSEYSGGL